MPTNFDRWKQSVRSRIELLKLLPKVSAPLTLLLFVIVLVGGLLPVALVIATGVLVGSVRGALEGGLDSSAGQNMMLALGLAGGMFLAQQVVAPFQELITDTLARRVDGHLRVRVMRAVSSVPGLTHLEDPKHLDQISIARGVGPAQYTPGGALSGLTFQAGNYIQGLLAALIVASFNWPLTLFILVYRLSLRRRGRAEYLKQIENQTGQAKALRRSDYFRELALRPDAAKETRIFGLREWVLNRFSDHWLSAMGDLWRQRWKSVGFFLKAHAFGWVPLVLLFGLIARAGVNGTISVGQVTAYLMAVFVMRNMSYFGPHDQQFEFGLAALPAVLKLEETTAEARLISGDVDPSDIPSRAIQLDNVRFAYPGSDFEVLSGINLTIEAGKSLAIVGANGAGKTTLIKLLCRFYDPNEGRITVDDIDLRELDTSKWQERLAAIFQDFVRYDLPARENIGFGRLAAISDKDALELAAQRSGADSVISGLSKGWDTMLSREYSDGAELSGGQWQKIALARAMLAASARPAVLILDEPTANLDVRAEAEIYERFLDITRGLTTIVISHRFSTVRRADQICVVDGGVVTERGSHDELLSLNGRYAEMFHLQASRFREDAPSELGSR
jgi:ATP-binding cassette subfamily B protein